MWMKSALAAGLLLAAGIASAQQTDPVALKVGDKAPDFKMLGSDGKQYSISQFKGKKGVMLAWFPKAFTGG